ncbi:MAG: hypothetical protein ACP6IP_01185 [Candidatus Njordarchaeia archaeon]
MEPNNEYKSQIKNIPFLPVIVFNPDNPEKILKKVSGAIILTLFLAFLSAITYLSFFTPTEEGALFRESQVGEAAAVYNLIIYLVMVVIFSVFIYILIVKRLLNLLALLQALLLGFIEGTSGSFFVTLWTYSLIVILDSYGLIPDLSVGFWTNFFMILQVSLFVILFIGVMLSELSEKYSRIRNALLILLSAWVGCLLGLTLGELTPILFMFGFALYDIFAVFKGPLKKISDELSEIMSEEGGEKAAEKKEETSLVLGLGDLFFYSLALSYSLAYLGLIVMLLVGIGIFIGALYTIRLAVITEERKALPALPIPIALALIVILISKFLVALL